MNISNIRYIPRLLVLVIDTVLLLVSLLSSSYIISKLSPESVLNLGNLYKGVLIVGVNVFFMIVFRTYAGIIRHSTFVDLLKIFLSNFCAFIVLYAVKIFVFVYYHEILFLPSLLFIYFAITFTVLTLFRICVKEVYHIAKENEINTAKKRILILGIGQEAVALATAVGENAHNPYEIVGFITQRKDSKRAKLLSKKIYSKHQLENHDKDYLKADGVLLDGAKIPKKELSEWVNLFLEKGLLVLKASSVEKYGSNENIRIRNLQIEDLLNRKPIVIKNEAVEERHHHKSVLITGGAGSIGSEIVRQVSCFKPSKVVILDQSESPLYEIELELKETFPDINFEFILGDISNYDRLRTIFEQNEFSMVYHAAAYKHVPLMEENPHEAIRVNIKGTKNLAILSSEYKVNRFVMISTDKAVNPTNVMGASKRTAELFVQALQEKDGNTTKFITTRFGNVLGSNGSVIPHFKKQIEKGGPVTITHPDIVRYFMTIPEACELVLQAGTMGQGGEIYVFDMGEPVKILNLAKRMIKLSGLVPDEDIKIVFTGLRPGEKLYEELLSDGTKTLPTHHEKIMRSKDPSMRFTDINKFVEEIINIAETEGKIEVVRMLKKIVKEFKSNNSEFEILDK
ncbi:polysaccharide biosynthesis protein [Riemerella columbipharyngis]|nr:nucleoside-diphosphate sugar epimerase/dehydratase [Riemerella columbipharyngis]